MNKKISVICSIILGVLLVSALLTSCAKQPVKTEEFVEEAKSIDIYSVEDFKGIAQYVGKRYKNYTFNLKNDINLSTEEWNPIGKTLSKAFCGTLNGEGNSINGLKITGWNEDGTPLYIAKEIIGWTKDGEPVYRSSEIISVKEGEKINDSEAVVNGYVKEGDNEDEKFVKLEKEGQKESSASFGSVGLFGYTCGATIKNLNINNAEISFYTSGSVSYSGIVTGFDVASSFENINVNNGKILVSSIYDQKIDYDETYGTPRLIKPDVNSVKEYAGALVGYTKSNTVLSNGQQQIQKTNISNVTINNYVFDNTNYRAFYSVGFRIEGSGETARLVSNTANKGYLVSKVLNERSINDYFYPEQTIVGGMGGLVSGANISDVNVSGFNNSEVDGNKIINPINILGKSLYFGGVVGGLYDSTVKDFESKNIIAAGVYWKDRDDDKIYSCLATKKVAFGGAFADVAKSKIGTSDNASTNEIENIFMEFDGTNLQTICAGGLTGYADEQSEIENFSVKNVYFRSSDVGSGSADTDLGAIVAGAVGVLRNSNIHEGEVQNVAFQIISTRGTKAYFYARGIVSQVYGNSGVSNLSAEKVYCYKTKYELDTNEYEEVTPIEYKNNYVNEDGRSSARLYYMVNGKYSGVYVTVNGIIVPIDENGNLLCETDVYQKVDLTNVYNDGDVFKTSDYDKYYRYIPEEENYILIWDNTINEGEYLYKTFDSTALYAEKTTVYRVEFTENNKTMALSAGKYYEYSAGEGKFELTTDTNANPNKTYYVMEDDSYVDAYYLDIKVYSESGHLLVVDEKNKDDESDDVLAEARYRLEKSVVNSAEKRVGQYIISDAELFLNNYFEQGVGFKEDVNHLVIKYYDQTIQNRDFSKYQLITGRPNVDEATVTYIK